MRVFLIMKYKENHPLTTKCKIMRKTKHTTAVSWPILTSIPFPAFIVICVGSFTYLKI